MPVTLFTGLPGAGKTASLVKCIVDLHVKEPGRPIFQFGIKGLKDGLAIPLSEEQLHKWWELPQGSIICIDECQEDGTSPDQPVALMPKDRGAPAAWVQHITKVRHYGMDFYLTTQSPANMSAYVRRLVDRHVHSVMRAKGVRQTFEWPRCIDNPDSRNEHKHGQMSFASVPKDTFDLYKSSSLHTMKVRTPRMFYWLGALLVVAAVLAVVIPYRLHKTFKPEASPLAGASSVGVRGEPVSLRRTDYVKWITPRVAAMPWTAPAFDGQEVKAEPRLFCIAVDDGRCHCVTEQGTAYALPADTCRMVASAGVYNPFLPPPGQGGGSRESGPAGRREAASPPADLSARVSDSSPLPVAGGVAPRGVPQIYTPPSLTSAQ